MVFLNSKEIRTPPSAVCSHPALGDCMQGAYENIIDEIMDYLIEGICFESHRAVKLGYFPVYDYIVSEQRLERYRNTVMAEEERDIFFNDLNNEIPMSTCPFCCQKKAAHTLVRHMNLCKRINDNSIDWNNGRRENDDENNINVGNIVENGVSKNGITENGVAENGVIEDRVVVNGVAERDATVNNIARNRIAAKRIENGGFENGFPINRCRNRKALHTVSMNSNSMIRISEDRVVMNRVSEDRIALNRISMNRMIMNRIAMNRIVLNRMALNNLAVNRISMNGVAGKGIFEGGNNVISRNDSSGNGIYENGIINDYEEEDYEVNENRNGEEENANGDADGREDDYREQLFIGDEEYTDEEEEDTDGEDEDYVDRENDFSEANKENLDDNVETIIANSVRRSADAIIDSLASRSAEAIIETFASRSAESIIGRAARRSAEEIMGSFPRRSTDDITEGSSRRSADDSASPDDLSTPESPISDFGAPPTWDFKPGGGSDIVLAPESPLQDSNSGSTPWRLQSQAQLAANRSCSEVASFVERSTEELMASLSKRSKGVMPSCLDSPVLSPSDLRPVVLNNDFDSPDQHSDSSGSSPSVLLPDALHPVVLEDLFLTPAATPENSLSPASPPTDDKPADRVDELFSDRCGVICPHSFKPCLNPSNCAMHSKQRKKEIRKFIFRTLSPVKESDSDSDTDSLD